MYSIQTVIVGVEITGSSSSQTGMELALDTEQVVPELNAPIVDDNKEASKIVDDETLEPDNLPNTSSSGK